jgi:two-component system, chemotaxis family, chemotaxis protein CheY
MTSVLRSLHHRVLVADDEPITLEVIRRQMLALGFAEVVTATSATEVLRLLRDSQFGLVVCDYMVPPINGLDLRRVMMSNKRWAKIPFIIVTAPSTRQKIWPTCSDIVDDVLAKPFGPPQLALSAARALGEVPKQAEPSLDVFEV